MSSMTDEPIYCIECDEPFESEGKLRTHVLLNHPELARADSEQYTSEVSKGHLEERDHPKGESFGYRK